MARRRPPSAGSDPLLDLARHRLRQLDLATPARLAGRLDRLERTDPTAERVRPTVSGSRTDGTALANLLAVLARQGVIDDRTEE